MKRRVLILILSVFLLSTILPFQYISAEGSLPPLINTPLPHETADSADLPEDEEPAELPEPDPDSLLRIHQINIGCGDAYLLTIGDIVILVDCGSNTEAPISAGYHNYPLLKYLDASGIDHVDVYLVTHWHNDHCYNVNVLLGLYGTENTIAYGTSPALYEELYPLAAGTYRQLKDGDRLTIGPLDVLCVGPEYRENITGTFNADSLNFIVTYGKVRAFFDGDFIQTSILERWSDEITDLDIVSFPHHGINLEEQSPKVYHVLNPRVTMIPSQERGKVREYALYTAYCKQDAVYLSSRDGHILVNTDGKNIWYNLDVTPGELPLGTLLPPRDE